MCGSQKNTSNVCSSAQMPLDACGHLLCNISVESSGGGPRQMALHLGNASAQNVNSHLTWIEIYMLSAATALGIFLEKVLLSA